MHSEKVSLFSTPTPIVFCNIDGLVSGIILKLGGNYLNFPLPISHLHFASLGVSIEVIHRYVNNVRVLNGTNRCESVNLVGTNMVVDITTLVCIWENLMVMFELEFGGRTSHLIYRMTFVYESGGFTFSLDAGP